MTPLVTAFLIFACVLGGALVGMRIHSTVPEQHLGPESRDVVPLAMGLTATMTALVLGLVTASSKSSFDTRDAAIKHSVVDFLALDRLLMRYGPEAQDIRSQLHRAVESRVRSIWPESGSRPVQSETPEMATGEGIEDRIRALSPRSEEQRWLQGRALEASSDLLRTRWVVLGLVSSSIPRPFLIILVLWLTLLFVSFGLFAPRNLVVIGALAFCAVSVASAIFLILEMDTPFTGLIKISDAPVRYALSQMGK